ncbi:GNAT family N-acetyltransferase [Burkholderia glumae]|uniref:GNAT family N-acetyltransferase n=2 Tax=Burkholderia glumae TaxID=337 RepID=UPI001EEE4280|nr:GNAT family N-acetyltransferase [Burkholderia glumae]MCM2493610.1 GNAT family N-acetyltransferase [Burkholderia glumae]MCM2543768.1 GNAT family N-acetyltransferase [Burkholderia glumae]
MNGNRKNDVALVPFEEGAADMQELFSQYEAALRAHIDLAFGWDDEFQRRRFAESYACSDIRLIEVGAETAGYAVIRVLDHAIHLSLLILKPSFQRQGIGRAILTSLMAEAGRTGKQITLSCLVTNSEALAFYDSMKFQVASTEPHFINYRFPGSTQ